MDSGGVSSSVASIIIILIEMPGSIVGILVIGLREFIRVEIINNYNQI